MRAIDGTSFSNISATTSGFALGGGLYGVDMVATGTGTLTLQKLGADGSTWVACFTGVTTTTSYNSVWLPAGTYRLAVATFTAVYANIRRIPEE